MEIFYLNKSVVPHLDTVSMTGEGRVHLERDGYTIILHFNSEMLAIDLVEEGNDVPYKSWYYIEDDLKPEEE